jgi:hypothetical protein
VKGSGRSANPLRSIRQANGDEWIMQQHPAFDAAALRGDVNPRARGATCERAQNPEQAQAPYDVAHNPVFQGVVRILHIKEGEEQAQSRLSKAMFLTYPRNHRSHQE